MFGLWYITFGFVALLILSIVSFVLVHKKLSKYTQIVYKNWRYTCRTISNEEYQEAENKQREYDDLDTMCLASLIFTSFIVLILSLVSWLVPFQARKDVAYFEQQKEYVEFAVKNGSVLENFAITQTIIEQNEWLAHAKASIKTHGVFSKYIGTGVEDMEPIIIKR